MEERKISFILVCLKRMEEPASLRGGQQPKGGPFNTSLASIAETCNRFVYHYNNTQDNGSLFV